MVILEKLDLRQFNVERDAKTSGKKSRRKLRTIKKSPLCIGCGLCASVACLVEKKEGARWQIYGEKGGSLLIFTIDHILPQSFGGSGDPKNLQVMCEWCNTAKADSIPRSLSNKVAVEAIIKRSCLATVAKLGGRRKYKSLLKTYIAEFSIIVDATNSFLSTKLSHEPKEITDGKNRKTKKQKRAKRNRG